MRIAVPSLYVPRAGRQTGASSGPAAAWNPSDKGAGLVLSVSNTRFDVAGGAWQSVRATRSQSAGIRYYEILLAVVGGGNNAMCGVALATASTNSYPGSDANGWGYQHNAALKFNAAASAAYGPGTALQVTDVIGVLMNVSTGSLTYYFNGVSLGVAFSGMPAGTYFPIGGANFGSGMVARFSSADWTNAPGVGEAQW